MREELIKSPVKVKVLHMGKEFSGLIIKSNVAGSGKSVTHTVVIGDKEYLVNVPYK